MTTTVPSMADEAAITNLGPAPRTASTRDERIDFIRGWVMVILIVVHTEFFSLWNLVVWERTGVISGGEGFVALSGLVLGMVSRGRLERHGWRAAASRLIDRAFQLYRVHVVMIALVAVLAACWAAPLYELVTFTDRASGTAYPLYPGPGTGAVRWIASIVTLRSGPHQLQVLGLYVCLMVAAPLALAMLARGRTRALLAISWILYFTNVVTPRTPTGAQFEYGFPLLTWQVLFIHGLAAGFHWDRLRAWFATRAGRIAFAACLAIVVICAVFAQGTTNPLLPAWARIDLWGAERYNRIWTTWCQKNTLGLVRLADYAAFLVVAYAVLTRCWKVFARTLGWFLIPIGQATLYVFILHVFVVAAASTVQPFGYGPQPSLVLNTALHTAELAVLWLMVKHRVLFRWIPR